MKLFVSGLVALALTVSLSAGAGVSWADEVAAKDNYKTFCAKCHGDAGDGHGNSAATLENRPASLADCTRMAKIADGELFKAIKNGGVAVGKSKEMMAFADGMEDDQIRDLVGYVRAFCKR